MATTPTPTTDDLMLESGGIPSGQRGTEKPAEPPPRKDPTQSLNLLSDDAVSALDKLRDELVVPKDPPPVVPDAKPAGGSGGDTPPKPEGTPAATPAPAAGSPIPVPKPVEAPAPKAGDPLEEVHPPEGVSPKTTATWNELKSKAKAQLAERDAKIESAKKELEDIKKSLEEEKKKAAEALTPEQKAEVEELRKWRNAQAVHEAPELKSLDSKMAANTDSLLAKLKEAGMVEAQISEVRRLGIENVNWEPLKQNMSPQLRLLVDAKVGHQLSLKDDRDETYNKLKSQGEEYLAARKKQETEAREREAKAFADGIAQLSKAEAFAFIRSVEIPKDATAEQRKALEADNKFAAELQKNMEEWTKAADRPETKAELVFGCLYAHKLQRDLDAASARIKGIEAENKQLADRIDAIKRASGAGRSSGSAVAPAAIPGGEIFSQDGKIKPAADALDELAAGIRNR